MFLCFIDGFLGTGSRELKTALKYRAETSRSGSQKGLAANWVTLVSWVFSRGIDAFSSHFHALLGRECLCVEVLVTNERGVSADGVNAETKAL